LPSFHGSDAFGSRIFLPKIRRFSAELSVLLGVFVRHHPPARIPRSRRVVDEIWLVWCGGLLTFTLCAASLATVEWMPANLCLGGVSAAPRNPKICVPQ
jgi:hypothetical protein